jgi:hypothetical protein
MYSDSPLLQILLTKFEAKRLFDALPPSAERFKLRNKIMACDMAINFLKANSESGRQFLECAPKAAAPMPPPGPQIV